MFRARHTTGSGCYKQRSTMCGGYWAIRHCPTSMPGWVAVSSGKKAQALPRGIKNRSPFNRGDLHCHVCFEIDNRMPVIG